MRVGYLLIYLFICIDIHMYGGVSQNSGYSFRGPSPKNEDYSTLGSILVSHLTAIYIYIYMYPKWYCLERV